MSTQIAYPFLKGHSRGVYPGLFVGRYDLRVCVGYAPCLQLIVNYPLIISLHL